MFPKVRPRAFLWHDKRALPDRVFVLIGKIIDYHLARSKGTGKVAGAVEEVRTEGLVRRAAGREALGCYQTLGMEERNVLGRGLDVEGNVPGRITGVQQEQQPVWRWCERNMVFLAQFGRD